MNSKYLTESARITDAYSMIYASKTSINESKDAAKTAKPVNESSECGSLSCALKSGDLPTEGKGSAKTGSKLGRRPMMPFEKRDAKSDAGHRIPMKKTFGNGKVSGNFKTKATDKSTEIGSSQTGSKLGAGKMVEFDKRDAKPTAIGKVGGVKNVGCVKGIKESEDDFEMEVIDTNVDDGVTDVEDVEKEEGCCEKCKELLELVKDTFEQIYDNLSDDDKSLVDEVKSEIEEKLSDGEDEEEEEVEDADDEDEEKEEETDESVVNEAGGKSISTGAKVAGAIAKGAGKTIDVIYKMLNGAQKAAVRKLIKAVEKGATKAEMEAAIQSAKTAKVPSSIINTVLKKGKPLYGAAAKSVSGKTAAAAADALEKGAVKTGGALGFAKNHPLLTAGGAVAADRYLLGGSEENKNAISSTKLDDEEFEKEVEAERVRLKALGMDDKDIEAEIAKMREKRLANAQKNLQNSKGDVAAYGKNGNGKTGSNGDDDAEKRYEEFRNHMDRYNADKKGQNGGNSQGGSYGLMDGLGDLGAGIGTALGTPLGAVGGIVGKVGGGLGNAIGKLGGGILGGGTYS